MILEIMKYVGVGVPAMASPRRLPFDGSRSWVSEVHPWDASQQQCSVLVTCARTRMVSLLHTAGQPLHFISKLIIPYVSQCISFISNN